MVNKPVFEIIEIKIKRSEFFLDILGNTSMTIGHTNGGNDKVLVNIQTSTIETVNLKHKKLSFQSRRSGIDCQSIKYHIRW